jgi:HSP20 family protein
VSKTKSQDPVADLFGEFGDRLRGDRWLPDVDVFESSDGIVVRVELAGVKSPDIQVTVDAGVLRVRGIRRVLDRTNVQRLHQMEIATGPFERRVEIPIPIDREAVTANLANGFLTVVLPRRDSGPHQVEIED